MKWIGGVILLIITIILLIVGAFFFPWFTTKTEYNREVIDNVNENYWDDKLSGVERDWDESTYHLQHYELETSRAWDWNKNGSKESKSSGKLLYNSAPEAGGWDGSYRSIVEAGYPPPGFMAGGNEQLSVYNFTYYMCIFAIIIACIAIIFVIIAGLEKISVLVPKILVGVAIILVILAPLYFALALPPAIEKDDKELFKVQDTYATNTTEHRRPPEAGGIMGGAKERDEESGDVTSKTDFAPEFGWWLAIGAIFTTIISVGFVTGPAPAGTTPPDYSRRRYHEFDQPDERYRFERDYERGYGSPPQSGAARYHEDEYRKRSSKEYYETRNGAGDQYGYDERSDYYDQDYDRSGYDYDRRARAPAPPQSPGYSPPPPPRRTRGYRPPPGKRARRREPPRY